MEDRLRVGVITSPHGVHGEVNVFPTTDDPARFKELKKCYIDKRGVLKEVEIETPICKTKQNMLEGEDIAIIPILRAGLGFVDGMLALYPNAKVGHIGLYRDPRTHLPVEYYCKLPTDIEKRTIFVVDPMLATGGSAIDAINSIKQRGGKNIKFMCLIAAPEGIKALQEAHPDVDIYIAQEDERLNENAYIVPGLGDAGDRLFGTK